MSLFESEGSTFHPGRPGLRKLLGDLEADIMQAVWARGDQQVTVREIHEELERTRKIAYTTVMTVMGNLARKGLLQTEKSGKAHLYRASQSFEQFTEKAVGRIVEELMKDFSAPAMAHFARAVNSRHA